MSNWELFGEGLKLMIFGMGFVFLFLVVMIFAMGLMHKAIKPFTGMFPDPVPAAPPKKAATGDDAQLAAVAAAAVELFRRNGK
jgi:oxaloacetate decarboxylase gamma subunit